MVEITESKMVFGPYDDNKVFQIEKSELHKSVGIGVKTVEFILFQDTNALNFIEAKSSSPRPDKNNSVDFNHFIDEIIEKYLHSFNLYYAAILGRHGDLSEFATTFTTLDNSGVKINFLLIIKGHQIDWLPPLNAALEKRMIVHNKLWKSNCIVLNDDLAKEKKLIKSVVA